MKKTNIAGVYKNVGKKDTTFYIRYRLNERVETEKVGKASEGMTAEEAYKILQTRKTQDIRKKVKEKELNKSTSTAFHSLATLYFKKMRDLAEDEKNIEETEKVNKTFKNIMKEESVYRNFWGKWAFLKIPLNRLTEDHVKKFLIEMREKYSAKSISNALILAKSIIKHTNYKGSNPFLFKEESNKKMFKKPKNNRKRYLSEKECKILLNELKDNKQNYLIVLLSLTTGARPNSVINLKIQDFNFNKGEITLFDFKRKMHYTTKATKEVLKLVKNYSKDRKRNEFLFYTKETQGKKILSEYPRSINRTMDKLFNQNLEEGEERVVPYTLRHTFANLLLQVQKMPVFDVSQLLNHASVQTTIDHYIDFDKDLVEKELYKYEDLLLK